jgi:hypothetical protein
MKLLPFYGLLLGLAACSTPPTAPDTRIAQLHTMNGELAAKQAKTLRLADSLATKLPAGSVEGLRNAVKRTLSLSDSVVAVADQLNTGKPLTPAQDLQLTKLLKRENALLYLDGKERYAIGQAASRAASLRALSEPATK